jgi:hypothetical protein
MARRTHRFRPSTEALEARTVLSVTILIDYSRDTLNFFNTPAKRELLQKAADTLGSRLTDELLAIVPSGSNVWDATASDPATGADFTPTFPNNSIPANTLVIFAGGRDLPGDELGRGGFGSVNAFGTQDWLNLVLARGQLGALAPTPTDFGPWGGSIAFDTDTNWYFGTDVSGLQSSQNDFLSVAQHELMHLIGFGTAPSWARLVSNGRFLGPQSLAYYDRPGFLPLSADNSHWEVGVEDGFFEALMDPLITQGSRELATRLDFAGLDDLGWDLSGDTDGTISGATDTGFVGAGSVVFSNQTIGPNDKTDIHMYLITGYVGEVITVTTSPVLGGTSVDTYLRLFDEFGTERKVVANTFTYDSLTFTIPASARYYLGVSGAGNVAYSPLEDLMERLAGPTGDYNLSIRIDPAPGGTVADLAATIVAPATATRGVPFDYTATVANNGPGNATATRLTQPLPSTVTVNSVVASQGTVSVAGGVLTVNFGTLAAGATATVQLTVTPNAATDLAMNVTASAAQLEPNPDNNSQSATTVVSAAPVGADTTPPTVLGVFRRTTGKGVRRVTTIFVEFSEEIDPSRATDLAAYSLTKAGKARRGRPAPRLPVGIRAVSYANRTVTLIAAFRGALPKGVQLAIASNPPQGIRDLAGNALDGNHDGVASGDAVFSIR